MTIRFELDLVLDGGETNGDIAKQLIDEAGVIGVQFKDNVNDEFTIAITAPDEPSAFKAVELLYGPEDASRDSNRFFVYGAAADAAA
jgi:hypothetical protein